MKTLAKIKYLGAIIISFLITAACVSLSACDNPPRILHYDKCECGFDSTMIVELVKDIHNPSFSSPYELTRYRHQLEENNAMDSIFMSIPEDVLVDAAKVLLKQSMSVNLSDVIHEYLENSDIYDTLGSSTPEKAELEPTSEDPPAESYDTIIDGKQYKLVNHKDDE